MGNHKDKNAQYLLLLLLVPLALSLATRNESFLLARTSFVILHFFSLLLLLNLGGAEYKLILSGSGVIMSNRFQCLFTE